METTSNNSNFQQQKIISHSCLLYSPQIGSVLSHTFSLKDGGWQSEPPSPGISPVGMPWVGNFIQMLKREEGLGKQLLRECQASNHISLVKASNMFNLYHVPRGRTEVFVNDLMTWCYSSLYTLIRHFVSPYEMIYMAFAPFLLCCLFLINSERFFMYSND